nr:MAG TPA: hypothetical protein [Caudoviricetes sp.]
MQGVINRVIEDNYDKIDNNEKTTLVEGNEV